MTKKDVVERIAKYNDISLEEAEMIYLNPKNGFQNVITLKQVNRQLWRHYLYR